ncbi:unnamed protein product [Caenorhabditis bovis]|uniref:Thyroglobulin type-1 domain-containing protein n=1 Tax=Caenorhabditis bovis TaxID=2654633 RepID=A0A8S1E9J9_9PELO|nr:unnamed protein product [Caenorhabditis bovis]
MLRFFAFSVLLELTQCLPISAIEHGLGVLDISDSLSTNKITETRLDCASQRRKALIKKNAGDSKIYVPVCSKSNSLQYERVQCFETPAYCWCVNEQTGEPRIGTSTLHGKPNCQEVTTSAPKKKRKNRCKGNRRTRFLRRLVASLKSEMIMSGVNATKVSRDTALRWKFTQLDANKNSVLERSEWKPYKSILLQWKNARHCSRSLFKTCDTDKNRRLTFDEWRKCIVQEVNLVAAKRQEQLNPFLYVLRPE